MEREKLNDGEADIDVWLARLTAGLPIVSRTFRSHVERGGGNTHGQQRRSSDVIPDFYLLWQFSRAFVPANEQPMISTYSATVFFFFLFLEWGGGGGGARYFFFGAVVGFLFLFFAYKSPIPLSPACSTKPSFLKLLSRGSDRQIPQLGGKRSQDLVIRRLLTSHHLPTLYYFPHTLSFHITSYLHHDVFIACRPGGGRRGIALCYHCSLLGHATTNCHA